MAEKNKKLFDDYKINNKVFDMIEAEADKTNVDISLYDDKKTSGTEGVHTTLAAAGLVPGIGNVADILDAALYGLEGDKLGAGLSLLSAIPGLGLVTGSLKIGKQGTKAAKMAKIQKQQTTMVEQTQDVIKRYGGDPTDAKLVSETTDTLIEAADGLVKSGKEMDKLVEAGMDFEDALSYTVYKGSLEPRAIKAAKDLKKMGYTDIELHGKEAVDEMKQIMKRGKQLYENERDNKLLKALGIKR
jgi:hypothetical protein